MIEQAEAVPERQGLDWRIVFWLLFIVFLVADQLVKLWARENFLREGQSLAVIPNVFDLSLTYNKGIAFGMFQGFGGLLAPIAIAIAIGATYYSMTHRRESPWIHVSMALLASGALGNLFDRVVNGKVTDMFHIRAFEFPVFNLADSCITVAAAILIIRWGSEWFMESRKVPAGEILTSDQGGAALEEPLGLKIEDSEQ